MWMSRARHQRQDPSLKDTNRLPACGNSVTSNRMLRKEVVDGLLFALTLASRARRAAKVAHDYLAATTYMPTAAAQSHIEFANARIQASAGWVSQEYPKLE
jgi:hypothetical protein